jgi:hypothetical protein
MPYVVHGPADLRMLLRPRAILKPFDKPQLLVRIPQFNAEETKEWERRLTPLTQECGCTAGMVALGVYLLVIVAVAAFANVPDDVRQPLLTYLAWGGGFVVGLIASAVIGKTYGQCVAALRLHRACIDLEEQLALRIVAGDQPAAKSRNLMAARS